MDDLEASIECTYLGCDKTFTSTKRMKQHKIDWFYHFYCDKCDIDFGEWAEIHEHRLQVMAPYLFGHKQEVKGEKKTKCPHIVCEICGEEFGLWSSRLKHRTKAHQQVQEIHCSGSGPVWDAALNEMVYSYCDKIFKSAADLVHHHESGSCLFIRRAQYHEERNQKHIVKQIMVNPDQFDKIIELSKACEGRKAHSKSSSASSIEVASPCGRGVGLGTADFPALPSSSSDSMPTEGVRLDGWSQAVTGVQGPNAQMDQRSLQTIANSMTAEQLPKRPKEPHQGLNDEVEQLAKLIDQNNFWGLESLPNQQRFVLGGDGDRNDNETAAKMEKPKNCWANIKAPCASSGTSRSPSQPSITSGRGALSSFITSNRPTEVLNADSQKSSALARPNQAAINASLAYTTKTEGHTNLFYSRFWDRHHEDYNPDYFFNVDRQVYVCAFPNCGLQHEDRSGFETHMDISHAHMRVECPQCHKRFHTISNLVQHFEHSALNTSSRPGNGCLVARRPDYKQIMSEITGGFLNVKRGEEEIMVGFESKLGPDGKRQVVRKTEGPALDVWGDEKIGVQTVKYEARDPKKERRVIHW